MNKLVAVLPGAFDAQVMDLFDSVGIEPTRKISDSVHAVVFTGGTDLNAHLYGEVPHETNERPDNDRDRFEIKVWHAFKGRVPMIGICRGAQLLNVMNGGKLWQDVDGHYDTHSAYVLKDGKIHKTIQVSSIHHQMMRPTKHAEVLIVSKESTFKRCNPQGPYPFLLNEVRDPEVVYYPGTRSFCIQSHPEIGTPKEKEFFFEFLQERLNII